MVPLIWILKKYGCIPSCNKRYLFINSFLFPLQTERKGAVLEWNRANQGWRAGRSLPSVCHVLKAPRVRELEEWIPTSNGAQSKQVKRLQKLINQLKEGERQCSSIRGTLRTSLKGVLKSDTGSIWLQTDHLSRVQVHSLGWKMMAVYFFLWYHGNRSLFMHRELIDKHQTSLDITLLISLIIKNEKNHRGNKRHDDLQTPAWQMSQFYLYLQLVCRWKRSSCVCSCPSLLLLQMWILWMCA